MARRRHDPQRVDPATQRQPLLEARRCRGRRRQSPRLTVEALLRSGLIGETLALTGPCALTFNEALTAIESIAGHHVEFDGTPKSYRDDVEAQGMDSREVERLLGAFASLVADGDCVPTADVHDVTGRPAATSATTSSPSQPSGSGRPGKNRAHLNRRSSGRDDRAPNQQAVQRPTAHGPA